MVEGRLADVAGTPLPAMLSDWHASLPASLLAVTARIAAAGHGVWLVGGSVREAFLGRGAHDHDLCTTMRPEEMLELFPRALPTGVRFGTVTLRTDVLNTDGAPQTTAGHEGEPSELMFECTTLRTESDYADGRRPDVVEFGDSLAIDLSRRDFTMNAMAVDLARGLLHDPYGGLSDLQAQRLRAVGEASSRLGEDGLRVLRAYRFMDQGEAGIWAADDALATALRTARPMLDHVAPERMWMEFRRILDGAHVGAVLAQMKADGILSRLLPGWPCDLGPLTRLELGPGVERVCARLALLSHGAGLRPRVLEDDLRALTLSNAERSRTLLLASLLGHLPRPDQLRLHRAATGDAAATHLRMECALEPPLERDEVTASMATLRAHEALPPQRDESPLVDGHMLAEATGLAMGRRLGRLKSWLHRLQIEQDLRKAEDGLDLLDEIDWRGTAEGDYPQMRWPSQ